MACPISAAEVEKLRVFISFCSQNPALLNLPELEFFKSFIEQLGGRIPEAGPKATPQSKPEAPKYGGI